MVHPFAVDVTNRSGAKEPTERQRRALNGVPPLCAVPVGCGRGAVPDLASSPPIASALDQRSVMLRSQGCVPNPTERLPPWASSCRLLAAFKCDAVPAVNHRNRHARTGTTARFRPGGTASIQSGTSVRLTSEECLSERSGTTDRFAGLVDTGVWAC
jgi:hypothetical protein